MFCQNDEDRINKKRMIVSEEAKKNNKMEPGITFEECCNRFASVTMIYSSHNLNAWEYFVSVFEDIPQEHRLEVMLKQIYTGYHFEISQFYYFLKRILDSETEEQCNKRITENKKILIKYLDKEDFIKLYRGVNDNSLGEEFAISYTTSKSKAKWFANRKTLKAESEYKEVIEKIFYINEVLLYTNDRQEEEVIVRPECLNDLESYLQH